MWFCSPHRAGGRRTFASAAALVCLFATGVRGEIVVNVAFNSAGGPFTVSQQSQITSHVLAAGQAWASHLDASAALEVEVQLSTLIPRATGRSFTSAFAFTNGRGESVYHQGAGGEIITGSDPNGASPDIELLFNPSYLAGLWFDPDPVARTATIPSGKTDAQSVFLHELGHAIGINGWNNGINGSLPAGYHSTFDEWLQFAGTQLYFAGPHAAAEYGGSVPVTYGNPNHLGNTAPRPGTDLVPDLMNGVVFNYATRYSISALDLAILADINLPVVGEPPALVGDANGDCQVGAADYAIWAAQFGQSGADLSADFDSNGSVGAGDYTLWAANFGQSCDPGAAAVPEPASGLLAFFAALGSVVIVARRRRAAIE